MAPQIELKLTVPVDHARQLIGTALVDQGFTVRDAANGSLEVTRGSLGTTLVAGSLAGDDMHVRFDVYLRVEGGGTIAQVRRSALGGFLKGGAIGASKANDVVQEAAHRLGIRLAEQGVLEGTRTVDDGSDDAPAIPEPAAVATGGWARTDAAPSAPPAFGYGYVNQGGGIPASVDYQNRTNVVAIVALILGFLFPLGGIIAGAIALAQVKRTREKGRGLALGGIIVGSVLIVLIVIGVVLSVVIGLAAAQNSGGTSLGPSPSASESAETPGEGSGETVDVFTLQLGDCLNDSGSETVSDVEVIDCAQPHDFEVYSEVALEGDAYPGDDAVDSSASDGCLAAFPGFVGQTYNDSVLDFTYYLPTQESWERADDRLVSCLIGDPAGQTSGTLAGSAR